MGSAPCLTPEKFTRLLAPKGAKRPLGQYKFDIPESAITFLRRRVTLDGPNGKGNWKIYNDKFSKVSHTKESDHFLCKRVTLDGLNGKENFGTL